MWASALLLMAAACDCNGDEEDERADEASAQQQPADEQTMSEPAPVEDEGLAMGECPDETTLSVSSTHDVYPKQDPPRWESLGSVKATRSAAPGRVTYTVYVGNFEFEQDNNLAINSELEPQPGQALLALSLERRKESSEPVPFSTGSYDPTKGPEEAEQSARARFRLAEDKSLRLSRGAAEGTLEVTKVTEDEICGQLDVKDAWTEIEGQFRAPIM